MNIVPETIAPVLPTPSPHEQEPRRSLPESRPQHAVVDEILRDLREGDERARGRLFEVLQSELLGLAHQHMRGQPRSHTLQTAALVNEVYLRLCRGTWLDHKHFLLTVSRAMRSILVDHCRRRRALKRDRDRCDEPFERLADEYEDRAIDIEALQYALKRFEKLDPLMAQAVDLRFFGGLTNSRVAEMLGLSLRDFERRWADTRDWLRGEIQ